MKVFAVWMVSISAFGLFCSAAFAAEAAKGKALFNDPKLSGAASGKSCNSCHIDGKGLEEAGEKKTFTIMGKKVSHLEGAVDLCLEKRMNGKPLGPKSAGMSDLTAYIKSLKGMSPILPPKKRAAATGC